MKDYSRLYTAKDYLMSQGIEVELVEDGNVKLLRYCGSSTSLLFDLQSNLDNLICIRSGSEPVTREDGNADRKTTLRYAFLKEDKFMVNKYFDSVLDKYGSAFIFGTLSLKDTVDVEGIDTLYERGV